MRNFMILLLTWSLLARGTFAAEVPSKSTSDDGGSRATLDLKSYWDQVLNRHGGYKASVERATGARLRSEEAHQLIMPTWYTDLSLSSDKKPSTSSAFTGDQNIRKSVAFGFKQNTTFGLNAKLGLTLGNIMLFNANSAFVTEPNYWEVTPVLELTQSLWRNGFGAETRAQQELSEAGALATSFSEAFNSKVLRMNAEVAYWRLAVAREVVKVQTESAARAKQIRDLNARKLSQNLTDRSNLIQSEAALKLRELDLQNARDEEKAAALAFNSLRGSESEFVTDPLQSIDFYTIQSLEVPARAGAREDLKAAEAQSRVAAANADIGLEKNSPTFDIYANTALNGKNVDLAASSNQAFGATLPTITVGFRFSAALDFGVNSDARAGYRKEALAADYAVQRKRFEQDRDWQDLSRKFYEAKRRLELARLIELTQEEKLKYEKQRLSTGRTTTYQVLLFEQEFLGAQLARIRTQFDVLSLHSNLQTYALREKSKEGSTP